MRALALIPLIVLAGCAASDSPPPQTAPTVVLCPSLTDWSKDQEVALATALKDIPESSPIWRVIREWTQSRAAARSCKSTNH